MEIKKENVITFLDAVQRTIIGEQIASTDSTIIIRNPVVVDILPQRDEVTGRETGQMALRLLPLFFREFLALSNEPVEFVYNTNQITFIKFEGGFNFKLYAQYESIFNPSNLILPSNAGKVETPATKDGGSPVINLFDESK